MYSSIYCDKTFFSMFQMYLQLFWLKTKDHLSKRFGEIIHFNSNSKRQNCFRYGTRNMEKLILIFLKSAKTTTESIYNKQFDASTKPEKICPFYITVKRQRLLLDIRSYRTIHGCEGLKNCMRIIICRLDHSDIQERILEHLMLFLLHYCYRLVYTIENVSSYCWGSKCDEQVYTDISM